MLALELLPERECSTCNETQKEMWGCEADCLVPLRFMGEETRRCPRRPIYEDPGNFGYWLRLYRNYTLGILPEEGGILDQSSMTVEVFKLLDHAYAMVREHNEAEQTKRRSKSGGGQKGRKAS